MFHEFIATTMNFQLNFAQAMYNATWSETTKIMNQNQQYWANTNIKQMKSMPWHQNKLQQVDTYHLEPDTITWNQRLITINLKTLELGPKQQFQKIFPADPIFAETCIYKQQKRITQQLWCQSELLSSALSEKWDELTTCNKWKYKSGRLSWRTTPHNP